MSWSLSFLGGLAQNLEYILQAFEVEEASRHVEAIFEAKNIEDYYPLIFDGTEPNTNTTANVGSGGIPPTYIRVLYFYHPDYLGNVEYITDMDGEPYQYMLYTTCDSPESAAIREGEALKDEKNFSNIWDSPYRFNGKELDEETGLYYYGARYYNPQVSVWLSVDPLSHSSPNQTPYHFVSNNPIMMIDPDGRKGYKVTAEGDYEQVDDTGGDEFDILYNEDMSSAAATTFEPGTFDKNVEQGRGKAKDDQGNIMDVCFDYQTFEGNDAEKGEILYNFVKDNTNVEWSKVSASSSNGDKLVYVSTSHSDESTYGGVPLTKKAINTRMYSDVHWEHSHSRLNVRVGPSDWSNYPNSGGDLGAVQFLYTTHAPYFNVNLRTSIYDKTTKQQVFYNNTGIIPQ